MCIPYRPLALAYRIVALVLVATGITRLAGLFSGDPSWATFLFFTTLSNVLCLAWFAVLVWRTSVELRSDGVRGATNPSPRFGGAVMMAVTVTMLVYLVVLVPTTYTQGSTYKPFTLTDDLVHIVAPCLAIGDWLLFTVKGRFRWIDPLLWAVIPWAYLVFAFAWAGAGLDFGPDRKYPYPFLDVDVLGVGGVAAWITALSVILIGIGYVYIAADRLLGRIARVRSAAVATVP